MEEDVCEGVRKADLGVEDWVRVKGKGQVDTAR